MVPSRRGADGSPEVNGRSAQQAEDAVLEGW